jgi:hypothetical protein
MALERVMGKDMMTAEIAFTLLAADLIQGGAITMVDLG